MFQRTKQQGYTLLEVMIALAIFSVLALLAVDGIYLVMEYYQHTRARLNQLAALQSTEAAMFRDLTQIIDRPLKDSTGWLKSVVGADAELAFTRGGSYNAFFTDASALRRVSYRVQDHKLYRQSQTLPKNTLQQRLLLENVQQFQVKFLDSHNQFQNHWPIESQPTIPKAIAISVEIAHKGVISWLFIIPAKDIQNAAP